MAFSSSSCSCQNLISPDFFPLSRIFALSDSAHLQCQPTHIFHSLFKLFAFGTCLRQKLALTYHKTSGFCCLAWLIRICASFCERWFLGCFWSFTNFAQIFIIICPFRRKNSSLLLMFRQLCFFSAQSSLKSRTFCTCRQH